MPSAVVSDGRDIYLTGFSSVARFRPRPSRRARAGAAGPEEKAGGSEEEAPGDRAGRQGEQQRRRLYAAAQRRPGARPGSGPASEMIPASSPSRRRRCRNRPWPSRQRPPRDRSRPRTSRSRSGVAYQFVVRILPGAERADYIRSVTIGSRPSGSVSRQLRRCARSKRAASRVCDRRDRGRVAGHYLSHVHSAEHLQTITGAEYAGLAQRFLLGSVYSPCGRSTRRAQRRPRRGKPPCAQAADAPEAITGTSAALRWRAPTPRS